MASGPGQYGALPPEVRQQLAIAGGETQARGAKRAGTRTRRTRPPVSSPDDELPLTPGLYEDWIQSGVRLEDFPGTPENADWKSEVRWVASQLIAARVNLATAPSFAAMSMLRQAKLSPVDAAAFWAQQYSKLAPNRASLDDEQERMRDDGRDLAEFCEQLSQAVTGV